MRLAPSEWIDLCGRRLQLQCTLGALYRFEAATGKGIDAAAAPGRLDLIRVLVWCMLERHHPEVSQHEVGAASLGDIVRFAHAAARVVAASSPHAEPCETTVDRSRRLDWDEMWAVGCFDLRLSEEQFWGLTPALFSALCRRLEAAREYGEYCAGIVAATTVNCHLDPNTTEPFEPAMWVRGKAGEEAQRRRATSQAEALSAKLRSLGDFLPGLQVMCGEQR